MKFKIGKITFSRKNIVVIAEAGVNHLGDINIAEKLIKEASKAGANIIKFQTYKAKNLTTKNAPRFWNWEGEEKKNGSQYDSYSKLDSFGLDEHIKIKKMCDKYNIEFMSTPFDNDSVDMLIKAGIKGFKIASCDITNFPLIGYIAKKKLPILLSTGASNIKEIEKSVKLIEKFNKKLCIMHCTLSYPTKNNDANLLALRTIKRKFSKYLIGLSDHTLGTLIPSASVLYGVNAIEKHFTIDKSLPISADHWLSLNPNEMKSMINNINILKVAMGNGIKKCLKSESLARKYARRSIVLLNDKLKGEIITNDCVAMKRPGTGLSAAFMSKVIGKSLVKNLKSETILKLKHLKK